MGSSAGNIIRQLAPLAISFIAPELAPLLGITSSLGTAALGAGLGGLTGAVGGGGIRGALTGALSGGLGAGGAGQIASGLGLSGTGAKILSSGLTGAANGLNSGGDLGSALAGGALGAGGGALSSFLGGADPGSISSLSGNSGLAGPLNSLDSSARAITGGGGASSVGPLSGSGSNLLSSTNLQNILSGVGNVYTQDKARDELLKSQQNSLDALQPFLANGTGASNALADYLGTSGNTGAENYGAGTTAFTPDDLQNDPGYQFNLGQGTNALNNSLAAAGNLGSGAAIKAGQQFSQGLADTTYNNAFNRDLQTKQTNIAALGGAAAPGLIAAGDVANVNNNIGTTNSKATTGIGNTITGTLANILSGQGAKTIVGFKADGSPIYA